MKRRINLFFLIVTFAAIITTMLLSTIVYYEIFKKEMIWDLETYASVLKDSGVVSDSEEIRYLGNDKTLRVTVVQKDGTVIFDNYVSPEEMENHKNRAEIKEALREGNGYAIRHSDTLEKNTFYFATVLENGSVLRVSKEADSIWSVFMNMLPVIGVIMLVLLGSSVWLTHSLTKSIVQPIEQMATNMEEVKPLKGYKELQPFISTIQKQHEDILQNARIRQEFTANVSHELKTPLTAISGYSELIENGMATENDVVRFAKEIHRSSNRLLTLINDIIRLSELDSSDFAEEIEQLDIYQIANTAVDMLQISAEKHEVQLNIAGNNSYINANRVMMEELVYNLIDNAIRYNKKDGVVNVSIQEAKDKVIFCVKDTGIGIPKEHQDRIFERFYRVDKSRSKSTGGTGLGLAIVKHIVAQHHANLQLESEEGAGTTITVSFDKAAEV